jgi:hypothetical protein
MLMVASAAKKQGLHADPSVRAFKESGLAERKKKKRSYVWLMML